MNTCKKCGKRVIFGENATARLIGKQYEVVCDVCADVVRDQFGVKVDRRELDWVKQRAAKNLYTN